MDLRPQPAPGYAAATAAHRSAVAEAVRSARAAHVMLRTDRDWVRDLARHVHGARPRRLGARRGARPPAGGQGVMSLASPLWLLALVPVALLVVAYLLQQRRRSAYAVRFATLPMLETLLPRRPGWRRHVPAALLLLASPCWPSPRPARRSTGWCPASGPP